MKDKTAQLAKRAAKGDAAAFGTAVVDQAARDFLAGKDVPFRSTALLNAASAIVADGHQVPEDGTLAERFKTAYAIAEEAVDSGKAEALLNTWIETAKAKKA